MGIIINLTKMSSTMFKKCQAGEYRTWSEIFDCTDPNSWAYSGIYIALSFSIIGAGLGIMTSGGSILASSIKAPRITSVNLISVIFCEAIAIYGVIIAILLQSK